MSQPIVLTNGQHEIKIYTVQNRGRAVFQLSFYEGGHRQRQTYGKLSDARREAKDVLGRLAVNTHEADALSKADHGRHGEAPSVIRSPDGLRPLPPPPAPRLARLASARATITRRSCPASPEKPPARSTLSSSAATSTPASPACTARTAAMSSSSPSPANNAAAAPPATSAARSSKAPSSPTRSAPRCPTDTSCSPSPG